MQDSSKSSCYSTWDTKAAAHTAQPSQKHRGPLQQAATAARTITGTHGEQRQLGGDVKRLHRLSCSTALPQTFGLTTNHQPTLADCWCCCRC